MSSKIGERVRDLRRAAGMSKQELAIASSVTNEVLERIEKENMNPSVPVMNKICHALGTRTGTVLDGAEYAGPVHMTSDDHEVLERSDYSESNLAYYLLARKKSDRNMDPAIIDVMFAPEGAPKFPSREGEEFVYVLEGRVELRYGNENYRLEQGDSIYFDSCVPHALSTVAEGETARVLAITYVPV